jgi:hypothetical protein
LSTFSGTEAVAMMKDLISIKWEDCSSSLADRGERSTFSAARAGVATIDFSSVNVADCEARVSFEL